MNEPSRIVSLIASGTEILYELGLGERVLAVSHECDYPLDACRKPHATRSIINSSGTSRQIDQQVKAQLESGGALYELDGWLLRQIRPDLLITQAQCDVCAIRYDDVVQFIEREPTLSTTIVDLQPASLVDVYNDVRRLGEVAGVAPEANRVVGELQGRIESIREAVSKRRDERPKVVCLEWLDPLMTAGNWTPELIELAGGQSCLATGGEHSQYVDWEEIREFDPDVMIVAPCGFSLRRAVRESQVLEKLPGWGDLKAVRRGQVYAMDGNAYLNRSGPRLVTTAELLTRTFHPGIQLPALSEEEAGRAVSQLETGRDL